MRKMDHAATFNEAMKNHRDRLVELAARWRACKDGVERQEMLDELLNEQEAERQTQLNKRMMMMIARRSKITVLPQVKSKKKKKKKGA